MKIYPLNLQVFQCGKFRLPVKKAVYGTPGLSVEKDVNWIREYSNPKAEELYKKALKTENIKEKVRLFEEMGEYRLIDLEQESLIDRFFNTLMKNNIGLK